MMIFSFAQAKRLPANCKSQLKALLPTSTSNDQSFIEPK
jgi:hypothetical protein